MIRYYSTKSANQHETATPNARTLIPVYIDVAFVTDRTGNYYKKVGMEPISLSQRRTVIHCSANEAAASVDGSVI